MNEEDPERDRAARRRRRSLFVKLEIPGTLHRGGGGGGGVYLYSDDTVEGPRAPAVKLTAHHSSLTRVRAVMKPKTKIKASSAGAPQRRNRR